MPESESSRSPFTIWALLLATLLGGFAVRVHKPLDDSARPELPNKKEAATIGKPPSAIDPFKALRDYISTEDQELKPFLLKEYDALLKQLSDKYCIEYLIVTVPDPVDSRFGFAFDQLMTVIQRALEENGYVFDRTWLPWELDKKKLKDTEKTPVSVRVELFGYNLRIPVDEPKEEPAYREMLPGMILFRGKGPRTDKKGVLCKGKLCVVYLIGENPTSGLDKRTFTASLKLIRPHLPAKAQHIRIVGPYFTGSQTSLKQVFDAWKKRFPDSRFRVISGSATEIDKHNLFPDRAQDKTTFHATVIPTDQVLLATLHYLKKRNESRSDDLFGTLSDEAPEKVAFLVEANTGFGSSVNVKLKGKNRQKENRKKEKFLVVPFPLHISGVEASYEKERLLREEQLGIPKLESLIPRLGKPPDHDSDLIAAQDPATTASVNGKVLTNILSVIAEKQMDYVGIVASDPRDTIFLATALREHCPDIQIFILGSDVLYGLPEFSYYLKGTIIGSTYPLLPNNQQLTDPDARSRVVFPSQSAQGYFNAIMVQMQKYSGMIEYRPPQLKHMSDVDRPPIWITMIGQNGDLVPLQFFTEYRNDDYYVWPPPDDAPLRERAKKIQVPFPSTAWIALVAVCLLAVLLLCYAFRHPSPEPFWRAPRRQPRTSFWWGMGFRTVCFASFAILLFPIAQLCALYLKYGASVDWSWRLFLLIPPFILLGLVGPALLYPLIRDARRSLSSTWTRAGITCAALALLVSAVWTLLWAREEWLILMWSIFPLYALAITLFYLLLGAVVSRLLSYRLGPWIEAGIACAALAVLAPPIFVAYLRHFPNSWEALFFQRTLNFSSGLSLLLPLFFLCAVFFSWSFFQMKGRRDVRRFSVGTPYPDQQGQSVSSIFCDVRKGGQELTNEIRTLAEFVRRHPIEVVLVLFVLVAGSLRLWYLFRPIAEGPYWTCLFFCGFIIGSLLVAIDLLRFLAFWSRLKNLFHEISLIPMMAEFGRLPTKLTSVFGGYLRPPRAHLSLLRLPLHQLRLLQQETGRLLGEGVEEPHLDTETLRRVSRDLRALELYVSRKYPRLAIQEGDGTEVFPPRRVDPIGGGDEDGSRLLRNRLTGWSRRLLTLLPKFWPRRPVEKAFGPNAAAGSGPQDSSPGARAAEAAPRDRFAHWVELAEGFVAMQVVIYISQFFVQLRTLVWSMIVCSVLLLLAATSYVFHPERLILYTTLALIGAVVVAIIYVLIQVNRDELVSRISGTTPNRFTLDTGFIRSVFMYIVPALSVVAFQLSGAFRFMLEPILRVLR